MAVIWAERIPDLVECSLQEWGWGREAGVVHQSAHRKVTDSLAELDA